MKKYQANINIEGGANNFRYSIKKGDYITLEEIVDNLVLFKINEIVQKIDFYFFFLLLDRGIISEVD